MRFTFIFELESGEPEQKTPSGKGQRRADDEIEGGSRRGVRAKVKFAAKPARPAPSAGRATSIIHLVSLMFHT